MLAHDPGGSRNKGLTLTTVAATGSLFTGPGKVVRVSGPCLERVCGAQACYLPIGTQSEIELAPHWVPSIQIALSKRASSKSALFRRAPRKSA